MSDTQTGDDAARAADATGPAAASAAVLAPPTRNPALSARNPALLSGRNPALSSRQRHDMRTASRARKMQAARRYGRYIPQDAIVRPETVVGIVSYNLPRKKSSHSYKLTPLGSVSPASAKFFDQAAKKRRSRTANSSTKRARSMPRRLQELHHGRQGGGASTAASAAELGRGMLRDGGFRPSTTTGTIGSAALVQSASMPAGSFLTGIDAGGPSRESPYNKSGTPFGGRPDTSLTQTSASSRPVTVTWADQSSSQAHSLGGALGHQRPSSPPPSFPGSTLRVHQEQHYDSDLDGSDLDEQDLESSLLSPAQLHSSMSQQERNAVKYFGLSGRDALFNHYKSVSTKRELRRDGVRTEFMYEVDRPRSPGRSYAENCLRLRMTPEPIHLRRVPTDRHLSLAHMGIGDRRLSALADSIGGLPGLHHLDVTDCRISDEAFVRLLENAEKRPADDAILSLKLSDNHIGHAGALGIADFLRHDITQKALSCHLTLLTLSNCQISDKVCSSICHAMVHNHTCTRLDISHNRLGIEAGSAIGEMLRVNSTLTDLDVSWNNIRGKGAGDIAFYLRGSSIRKLNMKMNVFGRCYAASMLGKWLPHTQVEYLDLSANHLTPLTVSILMNGLALFPTLKVVKLDENPLGMLGTSAVLRSFGRCHYDTGRTSSSVVSIWGCACDITSEMESVSQKKNATMESFDFHEPAGFYSLDLVKPADYALACEILYIANTRRRVDIKNCKYAMPVDTSKGKKPKFRQLKLVRSDGDKSDFTKSPPGFLVNKKTRKRWIVPEAGYINMMVKVRPQLPKEYDIVNPHVFNQVLKIIKEPHTDPNRMAIAHAACEGYIFSVGQVETILSTFSKSQAHALVPHFMLRLVANEETNNFIDKNRRFLSGSFARFYPQIPTGRYVLEMSDQADRALFKRLMEISNDERALEIKLKEKDDMSQKGDRSGFRNVTWKQEEFEVTGMIDEVEDVPRDGQIVLDFVSRNILKLDTPVTLTPETDDMTEEEKEARTIPAMPEECLSNIDAYCAWIHDKCVNVRWVRDFLIAKQPKPSDWMTLDQKITALFKLLDDDDGGEVDKMEVMKAIIERPEVGDFMCQIPELEPLLEPRTFGPAFDAIDQDGGGSLDLDEFRQMCGIATDIAEVAEAMFEADDDGDWDEGDDADLRAALKSLVGNKLNMAHKQLRQQMSNGLVGCIFWSRIWPLSYHC